MNSTLALLRPFLPETKETAAVDRILTAAQVGVGNAEQLYKIGELPPEKRKEAARQYINDTLTLAGVTVTPEVSRLVDGAIEAEVLKLGHGAAE